MDFNKKQEGVQTSGKRAVLRDQGWGGYGDSLMGFQNWNRVSGVAVASRGWPGSGGVPCLSLSLQPVLLSLPLKTIPTGPFPASDPTATGPGPSKQGSLPHPRRRKQLPGLGSVASEARPEGFMKRITIPRGVVVVGKACSHFSFSFLAETNFSVKTMKNQGGVSSSEHPREESSVGREKGGAWLEREVPRWGWAGREGLLETGSGPAACCIFC